MSLPIENRTRRGFRRSTRAENAFSRAGWAALALVGAMGCSGSGDQLVATIRADAAPPPPDVTGTCVPKSNTALDMGVDLYFIMEHGADIGRDEWTAITIYLNLFFAADAYSGMGVGFTLYPIGSSAQQCIDICGSSSLSCSCLARCGCYIVQGPGGTCQCAQGPTTCDSQLYSTPTFEIARLADQEQPRALFRLDVPFAGDAAIRPALEGSLLHRATWEGVKENEGRFITQVLVAETPSRADCDFRLSDAVMVLTGPDKPKTYVIAVNDMGNDLGVLAEAGGTGQTTPFSTFKPNPPDSPNAFAQVANKARLEVGRCEYLLPAGSGDPAKVNLAAPDGAIIPRVRDRGACTSTGQGWFYDPNQATRMIACENTCKNILRPAQTGSANIQTGCPTVFASDAGL